MRALRARLSYANVMATFAVFIALGGSSYAAIKLAPNSVGTRAIRSGAVRSSEIKDGSIRAADLAASTRAALRGQQGPRGLPGVSGANGGPGPSGVAYWAAVNSGGARARGNAKLSNHDADTGVYHLRWAADVSACGATVTLASVPGGVTADPPPGRATVTPELGGLIVRTYDVDGSVRDLPFNVMVAC